MTLEVAPLSFTPEAVASLSRMLTDVVAGGASVSFLHPLAPEVAHDFWTASLAAADDGRRIVLGARRGGELVATVTLDLATPPNQQHRAEIAKLMTHPRHRGLGAASALMGEAERIASERGRWLLTLDTAAIDGAAGFYERLGYQRAGSIPDYALTPHGALSATILYWKRLGRGGAR